MINHDIAQWIALLVVVYLLYRGAVMAPSQITPRADPHLQLSFVPSIGPPIPFTDWETLRSNPMFDIWNSEYVLKPAETGLAVLMVEDGADLSEGTVVGWLVEISTRRYTV